jgi:putative addiction module component (TIGR02574 family)
MTTAKLEKVVLALPARSRAKLAGKLLESLNTPKQKEIDALWAAEAESRIDAFDRGEIKAVSSSEVFRRLKARKKL